MEYKIVDTGVRTHDKHNEYLFEGIPISQHPDITKYFPLIINDFNRIIELGTYHGALTLYLHRIKNPEVQLISYDIALRWSMLPMDHGLDTRWGNYFDEGTQSELWQLINNTKKRILLLCDGGYKEHEFRMFAPYLKPNDVIMVHDYADTLWEYEQITHAINWYDIADSSYDGVKKYVEENNLEKHPMYNEFKSVLWGIFIKK
jgi:hypothetical protein